MSEKNPYFDFPENQRLLKLRDGTEVWAQTKRVGEGNIQLNLEIFPPLPNPPDETRFNTLFQQLSQLATNRGWLPPALKSLGRPTTVFFSALPESEMKTIKQLITESL